MSIVPSSRCYGNGPGRDTTTNRDDGSRTSTSMPMKAQLGLFRCRDRTGRSTRNSPTLPRNTNAYQTAHQIATWHQTKRESQGPLPQTARLQASLAMSVCLRHSNHQWRKRKSTCHYHVDQPGCRRLTAEAGPLHRLGQRLCSHPM